MGKKLPVVIYVILNIKGKRVLSFSATDLFRV